VDRYRIEQKESISATCRLFGVERQVYYRAVNREKRRRMVATEVVALIEKVRMRMPRVGTRKLYHLLYKELKEMGVGRDRLFAIIRANHLHIVPKRQYHITTNSHHRFRKHKNLIESRPIERPEQVWVSDITYIGTRTNPMYLSLVTDAYSKKIMGFNVSQSLNASGAVAALEQAVAKRNYSNKQLI
ncbi:DDE-type integrase/transposase/recombinase, partial [Cyclobacterium qasimii]|uniref:DDE-type integrase/transposase/recombinase n=1 Tax=Cyclobacterium qasimii TaxID=1350429 RepID=UPI0012689321